MCDMCESLRLKGKLLSFGLSLARLMSGCAGDKVYWEKRSSPERELASGRPKSCKCIKRSDERAASQQSLRARVIRTIWRAVLHANTCLSTWPCS